MTRAELNGTEVLVLQFFEERSRWGVECVDGSRLLVRPSCLMPLPPPPRVPAVFDQAPKPNGDSNSDEDVRGWEQAEASMFSMFRQMGVSVPSGRPLSREEAWAAAHESTADWLEVASARANAHGEVLSLDDIPEDLKDWRNFV